MSKVQFLVTIKLQKSGFLSSKSVDINKLIVDIELTSQLALTMDNYSSALAKIQQAIPGWVPIEAITTAIDLSGAIPQNSKVIDAAVFQPGKWDWARESSTAVNQVNAIIDVVPVAVTAARAGFAPGIDKIIDSLENGSEVADKLSTLKGVETVFVDISRNMRDLLVGGSSVAEVLSTMANFQN